MHEVVEVQLTEVAGAGSEGDGGGRADAKPVPVMVTTVPPPGAPATGLSPVTVGTAS